MTNSSSPGSFFFYDTGPPFDDFIYWMILFWLNLSYLIHSLQRLFTYNLRHFSLALSNHCSADGNVRGLPRILKSRSRILECMLTKKVGFELGAWSKNYLALIARREYEALNEKKWQAVARELTLWRRLQPSFGRIEMIGGCYFKVNCIL